MNTQAETDQYVADLNRRTNWWMVRFFTTVLLVGGLMLYTVRNIGAMNDDLIELRQELIECQQEGLGT